MTAKPAAADTMLPVATGRQSWQEVVRGSRGHRLKFVGVLVLGLLSTATGLVPPAAIGALVDQVEQGSADLSTVLWLLAVMSVAALLGALGIAATIVLATRSYHAMLAELRERLVERGMRLPQGVVENAGTGDLVSRSSDDVSQIADAAPQIIPAFTTVIFTIIVTVGGMAALDPWYALALLVLLPLYALTVRWYLRTGPRVYRAERAAMSTRAQQLVESQRGYETVVGLGLTADRHRKVLDSSWTVVSHSLRANTVQNMFFGRLNFAEFLGMGGILVVGFLLIGAGQSSIGATTAAMLLFLRLFGPINQLLIVVDILQSVIASLNRIVGVISMPGTAPPGTAAAGTTTDEDDPAAARVEDVTHRYLLDAPPALDGVSLAVGRRQKLAIVGPSGAGKSTLAAIIAGIHTPESGTVVRPSRTAVITQEAHIFVGTLRENLTLAAPGSNDEEVCAALRATGAIGLLDLLPDGLDTEVGAGKRELTPAQAQQIALARVVLADPEMVILDEATAEAGSAHAGVLDAAADTVLEGRTGLVIAHRLSQAAACDRIVVMEQGRITESGTHTELIAADGAYSRLWEAWTRGADR